jgi:hypothetical protein
MSNGKGDNPRNCHTDAFREGYDEINWHRKPAITISKHKYITVIAPSDENAKQIQEYEAIVDLVSTILKP